MEVNLTVWLITGAVILGFFIFDFYSHVRTPHEPTLKESAWWSVFYVLSPLSSAFSSGSSGQSRVTHTSTVLSTSPVM